MALKFDNVLDKLRKKGGVSVVIRASVVGVIIIVIVLIVLAVIEKLSLLER